MNLGGIYLAVEKIDFQTDKSKRAECFFYKSTDFKGTLHEIQKGFRKVKDFPDCKDLSDCCN